MAHSMKPYLSIVVPIFNEEHNIPALHERLKKVLDAQAKEYEIVFVDDGSRDRSFALLEELSRKDKALLVLQLSRNFGQHAAVYAGLAKAHGDVIVTLDADLQNPPEEIPKLVAKLEEGYDVVGGVRKQREDSWFRKIPSFVVNRLASKVVGVKVRDYGCMLRAYRRELVADMLECQDLSTFIPALANSLARDMAEVEVEHAPRREGRSKYHLFRLLTINFDLLTGFSLLPVQMLSVLGLVTSLAGGGFGVFLLIRRVFVGPESEGVFTLFAILFGFIGLLFLALGLIGEYIGRIYLEVRHRPKYTIRKILGNSR